ncbi:DUF420 domain-containing protein [bacterium]|nr:DUF420 domain-containing protein [bacterium]
MDYSIFPPINAGLNTLSTILLITGFLLIKSGRKEAHKKVMLGALASSAVFLTCYLIYHYGVGHTEFPKEYPVARRIYLAILIPHIILAVVNVPLIMLLVIAAFRGKFEKHKKLARFTFPSWLFVSITGVVIYFFIYVWFPPTSGADEAEVGNLPQATERVTVVEGRTTSGDLVFEPAFQVYRAVAGQKHVEVSFAVENTGAKPAKVSRLVSGCECLSVEIDQDPVPVGARAIVTGVFDTEKLRGQSERKITIQFEGESRPVFLTTRIETEPVYTITEEMTSWEIGSKPETKTVEFRVVREEPVRVLSAESKRKEVTCELVTIEDGRAYDLRLTPESTDESLLGIIRIETDCEIESYARPLAYFSIQ